MKIEAYELKYPKQHKGKRPNKIYSSLFFFSKTKIDTVTLTATSSTRLTAKQIGMIKKNISKDVRKLGVLSIRLMADVPISKKPLEIRMGKGKGAVSHSIVKVRPGFKLIEMKMQNHSGIVKAYSTLKQLQKKLPIPTSINVS
jgi:large subunit ribosomal protein L16